MNLRVSRGTADLQIRAGTPVPAMKRGFRRCGGLVIRLQTSNSNSNYRHLKTPSDPSPPIPLKPLRIPILPHPSKPLRRHAKIQQRFIPKPGLPKPSPPASQRQRENQIVMFPALPIGPHRLKLFHQPLRFLQLPRNLQPARLNQHLHRSQQVLPGHTPLLTRPRHLLSAGNRERRDVPTHALRAKQVPCVEGTSDIPTLTRITAALVSLQSFIPR